ncbi:aldehyde dehydrogenase family protein [Variovorax sp. Sphag1AA]|uniref:aldehyde dehydrogenase family protein n=1 Tax=Variovorax sp. Sphag1AA TaxID=2587027 RepID=UPI00161E0D7A|nr:aldehyde dehydrogenase family protein [Variovorax sp. Sphag1AA]MBB3182003.1 betaine-aldehyde dehydrogenase [Variovorax sp. Sphag1AA]
MRIEKKCFYVDGEWVPAAEPDRVRVWTPRTGEVLGTVPSATAAEADVAVRAARVALRSWAASQPDARAAWLERIADELEKQAEPTATLICDEVGTPIRLARKIQTDLPIANLRHHAAQLRRMCFEERVDESLVLREPVGVVVAITPWNYPLHQIVLKLAAALAAGCTVVLKPSEIAPLNAYALAEAIDRAGLPDGVFNMIVSSDPQVGVRLTTHPEVDKVSFTGSTAIGKLVAAQAAGTLKRVTLELGGKSAAIVMDSADLGRAVRHTVNSCFLNSGQTCTSLTRLLVPHALRHECEQIAVAHAAALAVGDPRLQATKIGPLKTSAQLQRVRGCVEAGLREGARLLCGGLDSPTNVPSGGFYMQPTIFGDVRPGTTIEQQEIFGPVLAVIPYSDIDDAVAIADGTPYGLAASVWGEADAAQRIARRLRSGQVDINGAAFNPGAPFGGMKESGYGREAGRFGIEDFLEYKSLQGA